MKFNNVALKDITKLVIDYRGKTPKKLGGDWSTSGIRALSAKNIKTGKIVSPETIRFVNPELYKKWMKDEIIRDDIFVTSEAPFGQIYYWDSDEKIVLSQRLFALRLKENVNSKYVYYFMTSANFQAELESRATGTTVVGLRQPELLKCNISLPDIQSQKQIATVLSLIDKKISLNAERIDILYKEAKCIIGNFLVDFNGFQIDEKTNTPIGWKEYSLDSLASFYIGYSYSSDELQESNTGMLTIKNFGRSGGFKEDGFKEIVLNGKLKNNSEIQMFDIVLAQTDLTQNADVIGNGEVVVSLGDYDKAIMSMDIIKLIPKEGINHYLIAGILTDDRFKKFCLGYVNGTTVLHLNKKALSDYKIILPNNLLELNDMCKALESIYKKIASCFAMNRNLQRTKDTLLPNILSGKIDVSKVEVD